jgi:hypothetical protein
MTNHALRSLVPVVLAAALLALGSATALADGLADRFEVHGYGNQDYMKTSANTYMTADGHGSWENNFLGLVVAATLNDQSKLWAQFQGSSAEGTRFTWFFVDYQLNDALRLHAGRVKLPLGFYNETIDVKALQLAAVEPSLYQTFHTGADMVHDAYQGVGADYEQDVGNGHLLWQLWAGNTYDTDPPSDSKDRQAWGFRVTYRTPIDGLRFMVSGYRTKVELLADSTMTNEDRGILSAEYVRDAWDIKAEYAQHRAALHAPGSTVTSEAYYLQAGYTFAEKWTPYARYDYFCADRTACNDPSNATKTGTVGLGYALASNIGLRIENHFNRGYGLPVQSGEVAAGAGHPNWNQFAAAVNFTF